MKNHGNCMTAVLTTTHPELARVFGSGALIEIEWEADLVDGIIERSEGYGAAEWKERGEIIEKMNIIGLTLFSDDRYEDDRVFDADAVLAFPRAVRAELCAAAREECEATR